MTTNFEVIGLKEYQRLLSAGFLLGVTHRKVTAMFQQHLRSYEITPEQWSVLFHIIHEEGVIQKRIAELTYKDKPTITRILHQLEQKGFIKRQADEQDRRSLRIYSTEMGQKLISETEEIEKGLIEDMQNGIGKQRYHELMQSLIALNDYLSNAKTEDEE